MINFRFGDGSQNEKIFVFGTGPKTKKTLFKTRPQKEDFFCLRPVPRRKNKEEKNEIRNCRAT
jgi:hypothetical protein